MSEVRTADPTLVALDVEVFVADGETPPVAHRWGEGTESLACEVYVGGMLGMLSRHAAWFAVPCPACFPAAPPRGTDPLNRPNAGRYLRWQAAR